MVNRKRKYITGHIFGYGFGVEHIFQQYFSYIGAVSGIGEGNRSNGKKIMTFRKSLTNFIMFLISFPLLW